jgi:gamma-butyrobetaine dioxygenase
VESAELLSGLPAIWLRANCPCPACLDPATGQRLVSITDFPAIAKIGTVRAFGDGVQVIFEPDQHEAVFSRAWLAEAVMAAEPADDRTEDAKQLWQAADFPAGPPRAHWPTYLSDAELRARCLSSLMRTGLVLFTDVPVTPGSVLDVAMSMSYVRETNYGRLFDVKVVADPANLAYTARAIGPHTDNPYRDPVPTAQLLHCLANAADGGDSTLVDGFAAAGLLRSADPESFSTLVSTPVYFRYEDQTAVLRASLPVIGVSALGRIRQIRFNSRSMQPVRPEQAERFYRAYRAFAEIAASPALALTFALEPGDCLVFDNTRILHARTAFSGAGQRHLQGCYADLDAVASGLTVLRRQAKEAEQ